MSRYKYILFDLDGTLTESAPGIVNSVLYALKKNGIEETDREKLLAFVGPPLLESFRTYYGVPEAQAEQMVENYREYFREYGWKENAVYEGIPEMLRTLCEQGRTLAVATSKPEAFTNKIIPYFHLESYFTVVCGATMDAERSRKGQVIAYALKQLQEGASVQGREPEQEKERESMQGRELRQDKEREPMQGQSREYRQEHVCAEELAAGSVRLNLAEILMVGDRFHDVAGAEENGIACVGVLYGYGTREELEQAGAVAICPTVSELPDVIATLEKEQSAIL